MVANSKAGSDPSCPHHCHLLAFTRMVQDGHLDRSQHLQIVCSIEPREAFDTANPYLQKQRVTLQQVRDMAAAHVASLLNFARANFLDAFEPPWRTEMVQWAVDNSFDRPIGLDRLDSSLLGQRRVKVLGLDLEAPWSRATLADLNLPDCSIGCFGALWPVSPCSDGGLLREACGGFYLHSRRKLV